MDVISEFIRAERRKRAWSQDQLARVSGLGLRTIQRIETSQTASFESIKSIAATFEVDVKQLMADNPIETVSRPFAYRIVAALGVACAALVVFSFALFSTQTLADQVMLDVGMTLNSKMEHEGSLLTEDGREAEIHYYEILKFLVTPSVQEDGRIFLSAKIYAFEYGEYNLISEPRLITKNNKIAEIRLVMENGDEISLHITPHAG